MRDGMEPAGGGRLRTLTDRVEGPGGYGPRARRWPSSWVLLRVFRIVYGGRMDVTNAQEMDAPCSFS